MSDLFIQTTLIMLSTTAFCTALLVCIVRDAYNKEV